MRSIKVQFYHNCYYEKIGKSEPVKLEDLPFDIPDSWTWVRHNSIFEIFGGSQPPKDKFIGYPKEGYIRLYQIRDYGPKPEPVYIPIKDAHKVTVKGDILLARYGASVGKVFFAEDGAYNVAMAKVEKLYVNDYIDKMFLYTFYKSSLYQSLVLNNSRSAQAGFNKEDLNSLLIPLPPLEEQIRIVEKINSFEPLIAQYSIAEERMSILEEEFPEKLKKSILQYAIEGKLVKQDPNDEPASVLLERIKAEKERLIKEGKIKRDKNESYIYQGDDKNYYEKIGSNIQKVNEPFGIPNYWKWVQIKEIFIHSAGKALNSSNTEGKKYPYITTSNVYWNSFVLENLKTMYYKDSEIEKCSATKGDLLVLEGGDIGRAAIWNYDYDIRIQNHIHRLRPLSGVNVEFYYLVFFLYKNSNSIEGRGIGLQGLSANRLKSLVVPLPTYHEQLIIVEAINKIFDLI